MLPYSLEWTRGSSPTIRAFPDHLWPPFSTCLRVPPGEHPWLASRTPQGCVAFPGIQTNRVNPMEGSQSKAAASFSSSILGTRTVEWYRSWSVCFQGLRFKSNSGGNYELKKVFRAQIATHQWTVAGGQDSRRCGNYSSSCCKDESISHEKWNPALATSASISRFGETQNPHRRMVDHAEEHQYTFINTSRKRPGVGFLERIMAVQAEEFYFGVTPDRPLDLPGSRVSRIKSTNSCFAGVFVVLVCVA